MGAEKITVTMIAAVARDGVIGIDGDMPWHIPSDFAHFKRTTMGKPIVMGRKQYETLGKPLPGRVNIVVSRQQGYQPDGVIVLDDFDAAIEHAHTIARADNVGEIMIIGGGEIYVLGMEIADRLVISHVDMDVEKPVGSLIVEFPEIDPDLWEIVDVLPLIVHERDAATYSIKVYHRKATLAH